MTPSRRIAALLGWPLPWPAALVRARRPRPSTLPLFDARGPDLRSFTKEIEIAAPAARAYALWTDAAAWQALMGGREPRQPRPRDRRPLRMAVRRHDRQQRLPGAQLHPRPHGQLHLERAAGAGHARAAHVGRRRDTETAPGRTRVRLTHLGFGQGADWDTTFAYFDNAWGRVLPMMKAALETAGKQDASR